MARFRIGALLLGFLWGCAFFPLSEAECKPESWHERGYDDGFGGHPPQDLRLTKECRRFGVEVSGTDYLAGYGLGRLEWEGLRMGMD
jgi:hypothetical protein